MTYEEMQEILAKPLDFSPKQRLNAARVAITILDCISLKDDQKNNKKLNPKQATDCADKKCITYRVCTKTSSMSCYKPPEG